ncbi:Type-F conjugative transfer system pilin assembly protein [Sphingobium sp. AP50]|uniref:type-F conjugative transfer system pilin assembly protein TrbC n=1 Tax=Sphingobium sp. AP50 TaxID=1884369 RepID=UPI0008CDC1A5|nr:type-F conjugative transfer system pilin assembly protein TrbC [Sphingobium sp. AP50]SEJ46754.1 Type-F conjugative transfer system pilin assembly protein [Sphingobium sp. AP50]
MRISRPSSLSLGAALALAGVPYALAQTAEEQQESGPGPAIGAPATGAQAMEALASARTRQSEAPSARSPSPVPPTSSAPMRKRAFEALRSRKPSPVLEERARAARLAGEAQLARDREAMGKRLAQALGLEAPSTQAIVDAVTPAAPRSWVPVLFLSSSIPITTLRTYAGQLERAHGVLAFRGAPGGLTKVGPMAKLSAEILRLDPGCEGPACAMRNVQLIVDPILFRQHGVARVPALGMLPGDPTQPYCEREEDSPTSTKAAHLVYGDAALTGMFEAYARLGGKEEVRDAQTRLERR